MTRRLTIVLLTLLLTAGCSVDSETDGSDGEQVQGAVVAVDGDLTTVRSFDIVTDDGSRWTFQPVAGLLFDDSEPISHLQDHMTSGHPVVVRYDEGPDGLIATYAGDAE